MSTSKQVYFITGCASGLGYSLVEHFLKAGQIVVATARDVSKVADFERRFPQTALALTLDVTDKTSIAHAIAKTIEKFGCIDVLINNAAISLACAAETSKEDDIRKVFETNFFGVVFLTQAVLPIMRKQRSGTIVQISSGLGIISMPVFSLYSASKHALNGFSEGLAAEVAEHGIRVVIVEAGLFRTKLADNSIMPSQEDIKDYEVVKRTLGYFTSVRGQQPGDPDKFAVALEKILALEKPPVHIPIGGDSLQGISKKFNQLLSEWQNHTEVITSTNFDNITSTAN